MQFLGVGWQEVLIVGVLAFFVIGPERMPLVAYQIGRAVRTLQQYARAVRDEFGEELTYVEDQYKTIKGDFEGARHEVRQQTRQIEEQWRTEQREIESGMKEAQNAIEGAAKVVNISDRQPTANGASAAPAALAEAAPVPEPAVSLTEPASGPPLVF